MCSGISTNPPQPSSLVICSDIHVLVNYYLFNLYVLLYLMLFHKNQINEIKLKKKKDSNIQFKSTCYESYYLNDEKKECHWFKTNIAAFGLSVIMDKTIFLTCCTFVNSKNLCKFALEHFISEFIFDFVKILFCYVKLLIFISL